MNEERLRHALKHIAKLKEQTKYLYARDLHDLMSAHEAIDRLDVAEMLVHHLIFRQETRWPGWQTRMDYPGRNPQLDLFVESVRDPRNGEVRVFTRPYEQLIPGDRTKES